MRDGRSWPLIIGLSSAAAFWVVGGALLLASWRIGVGAERSREAPTCAHGQLLTGADCRAEVAGEVTRLTSTEMDVTVDGHSVRAHVTISGQLPSSPPAIPVEVTLYRGHVIHVENNANLNVDTDAAPSTRSENYRNFGFCFVVFGAAVGVYGAVKTVQDRDESLEDPPWPVVDGGTGAAR
ncbi:hypothetical protein OWR29_17350 [Actinoplanes sp. Pm04-4]|uniref:Transmembrane protein n=1 Tax=Paractinoplanes pyxinae TaxID=2997416 RepID=A0ABT4B290_9ACTN|nr:hypothetical protein [Actinoplanes pyxinae]MCY1139770.1 hypothetical protein [Actinoplanes pyxinae]